MTTKLIKIEKSFYVDQYGIAHDCYRIKDEVVVERTPRYTQYDYYNEVIKNYFWESEDGRIWKNLTPTDFGAEAAWIRCKGEVYLNETWVYDRRDKLNGKQPYRNNLPILEEGR